MSPIKIHSNQRPFHKFHNQLLKKQKRTKRKQKKARKNKIKIPN